jgi:selenocysteine-specific elongation factor
MAKLRLLPVGGTPGEGAVAKAGDEAIAEVLLDKAVVAVRGDRFVLRRPSPRTTLGGGEVLDPRWRPGRGAAQSLALAVAGSDEDALLGWARQGSDAGVDAAQIAARLGCPEEEAGAHLGRLAAEHKLIEVQTAGRPTRWLAPAMVQAVGSRARALVEEFFAKDRLSPGMPKATLLSALLAPDTQALLGETYLKWFVAQKLLEVRGDRVAVPGRAGMSTGETDLAAKIVAAFQEQGLTPGSPQEICRQVGAKPQLFEGLLKHLVSSGQMVRLPDGLFLSRAALDRLEQDVSNQGWERFTVPEFKDHFGLSRKWAIPLLEYLDRRAITRREGDVRVLRR